MRVPDSHLLDLDTQQWAERAGFGAKDDAFWDVMAEHFGEPRMRHWVPTRRVRRSDQPISMSLDRTGYRGIVVRVRLPVELAVWASLAPVKVDLDDPMVMPEWFGLGETRELLCEVTVAAPNVGGIPGWASDEVQSWLAAWGWADAIEHAWARWWELQASGEMESDRARYDAVVAKLEQEEAERIHPGSIEARFRERLREFGQDVKTFGEQLVKGFVLASLGGGVIWAGAQIYSARQRRRA